MGNYFCYCKGFNCPFIKISQNCKYLFCLNIIDKNRYVYNKTDFLFTDFLFADQSSDDTFPVFERMINLKLPVHYITEKVDIFNKYCLNNNKCIIIIPINKDKYAKYGDFLEKYLLLILKLKIVVSGKYIAVNNISQLFYNLEYITYIAVGHGVCYFKNYLYSDYRLYGQKMNDKILNNSPFL